MVVGDYDIVNVFVVPAEAEPPLLIDADAELAGAAAFEGFETVAGWVAQVGEGAGLVEHVELAPGGGLDVGRELA